MAVGLLVARRFCEHCQTVVVVSWTVGQVVCVEECLYALWAGAWGGGAGVELLRTFLLWRVLHDTHRMHAVRAWHTRIQLCSVCVRARTLLSHCTKSQLDLTGTSTSFAQCHM